jgi:hypothetical protein
MAGFKNIRELSTTEETTLRTYMFRKKPTQTTVAGSWFDLSMSPGFPVPQYYAAAPLVATQISQSSDKGMFHGGNTSPAQKYLRRSMVMTQTATAVPLPMILCDYLLYYPFIDESVIDEQVMDNTASLSRYTDGLGVQIMAVVVAAQIGGQTFSIRYTNSDGVAGRVTPLVTMNTTAINGSILTSNITNSTGPFIPLQAGDKGVRSIQGVTCTIDDVGLFTLVLVKPLAQLSIKGIDAPVEIDYLLHAGLTMPAVADDAYLNFICCPNGTLAGSQILGQLDFTWR